MLLDFRQILIEERMKNILPREYRFSLFKVAKQTVSFFCSYLLLEQWKKFLSSIIMRQPFDLIKITYRLIQYCAEMQHFNERIA